MKENINHILTPTQCPDMDAFYNYLEGKLSVADRRTFELHLADCEMCSDALEGFEQFPRESSRRNMVWIHEKIDHKISEQKKHRPNFYWFAAAAAIVISVGLGLYLLDTSVQNNNLAHDYKDTQQLKTKNQSGSPEMKSSEKEVEKQDLKNTEDRKKNLSLSNSQNEAPLKEGLDENSTGGAGYESPSSKGKFLSLSQTNDSESDDLMATSPEPPPAMVPIEEVAVMEADYVSPENYTTSNSAPVSFYSGVADNQALSGSSEMAKGTTEAIKKESLKDAANDTDQTSVVGNNLYRNKAKTSTVEVVRNEKDDLDEIAPSEDLEEEQPYAISNMDMLAHAEAMLYTSQFKPANTESRSAAESDKGKSTASKKSKTSSSKQAEAMNEAAYVSGNYEAGVQQYNRKNYPTALSYFKDAENKDGNQNATVHIALTQIRLLQYTNALTTLSKLESNPKGSNYYDAIWLKAYILREQGKDYSKEQNILKNSTRYKDKAKDL